MKTYSEEIEKCARLTGFAPCIYVEVIIEHFETPRLIVIADVLKVRKALNIS